MRAHQELNLKIIQKYWQQTAILNWNFKSAAIQTKKNIAFALKKNNKIHNFKSIRKILRCKSIFRVHPLNAMSENVILYNVIQTLWIFLFIK